MKRIAILMVTVLLGLTATASSVHYFTRSQANRAVNYLNSQNELMIYCGYDYEIETYVLINEIWAERVNSAYYELWIFGYDAYTGDEIYMPLDLQCVWLYGAGHMYNAAQYLRFRTSVRPPHFSWYIPPYHPYTRVIHRPGYVRSYHYDIHRHGWMPPAHPAYHGPHHGPHHGPAPAPLHPYYNRTPQTPAPAPTTAWRPGVDRPQVSSSPRNTSSSTNTGTPTGSPRSGSTTGTPSNTRVTTGTATETRSSTGTTSNTRSTGTTTGTSTSTRSTSASSGTSTSTRSTSTSSSTSTSTRSTSGAATEARTTSRNTTATRSTSNTPTRANTGTATRSTNTETKATPASTRGSKATTTRSTGTSTSTRGTSTSTRSTGTSTSTRGTSTRK